MGRYRMKAVSRITGVRPELLRRWEKRYHLFKPQRADNRYREFDDEDVQLLQYICQQIDQGRSIGELAAEGREALLRQMGSATTSMSPEQEDDSPLLSELLGYIQQLDKGRLEARLAEYTALHAFATVLHTVFVPLMHRLGTLWVTGKLSIASEHFATMLFKQRLLTMLQATAPGPGAPLLLCACPAGEFHELGLLTFAYTMQQDGWHVCYLGPNLPVPELLYSCQHLQPALVALSLTYVAEARSCMHMLQEIDTVIAGAYPTFVGGQAVETYGHLLPPRHMVLCNSLQAARTQTRQQPSAASTVSEPVLHLVKVAAHQ